MILQGVVLARLLGPAGRGEFAAAILWPSLITGISGFGISTAVSRRAAVPNCDLAALGRIAAKAAFISGTAATAACLAGLPWLLASAGQSVQQAALWYLPFILFNHLAVNLSAIDFSSGQLSRYNTFRLLVNPLYLSAIAVLTAFGSIDVRWFAGALALSTILIAIFRLGLLLTERPYSHAGVSLCTLFREGMPFAIAALLGPILATTDRALVLFLVDHTNLGLYVVALAASSVLSAVAGSTATVAFGISAQSASREGFSELSRLFRLTAVVWIVAGTFLAAFLPRLLPLFYGGDYEDAILPAIFLIPGAALAGQASVLEESLRAKGHAFVGILGRLIGMAALIGLGLWWVPIYGLTGLAVASSAGQALVLLFMARSVALYFDEFQWAGYVPTARDVSFLRQRICQAASGLLLRR